MLLKTGKKINLIWNDSTATDGILHGVFQNHIEVEAKGTIVAVPFTSLKYFFQKKDE